MRGRKKITDPNDDLFPGAVHGEGNAWRVVAKYLSEQIAVH